MNLPRNVVITLLVIGCLFAGATPFVQAAAPPGTLITKVLHAGGNDYDYSGQSTAMDGDILAVGAPGVETGDQSVQGAVYIFYRNEGGADNWGQVKELLATDGEYDDTFGFSVAIVGTTVVVGAPNVHVNGQYNQGAVYIFERDQGGANNWGQVKKLTAADGEYYDHFGRSVAIVDGVIVVGAPHADIGNKGNQGAAYLFVRDQGGANNWGQVKKLVASDGHTGDTLGSSVALVNDIIVAGAPGADLNGDSEAYPPPSGSQTDHGAVYVFARNQGGADNWGQAKKIVADDGAGGDNLGYSIAILDDTVVAGAPRADDGGNDEQGAAYVFARNQGGIHNWGQVKKLTATDGDYYDGLGASVAIAGDTILAGRPGADTGGNGDQGAVHVFQRHLGGVNNWGQAYKLTAADGANSDYFGQAVTLSGDIAAVGAPNANITGYDDHGATYLYSLAPEPGLSITKSVTPQQDVVKHGVVTYTVALANSAVEDDPSVNLTDTLPAEVDFGTWLQQPLSATVAGDQITWIGPVSATQAITFSFTATHTGDYGDVVTNLAEYSGTARSGLDDAVFAVEGPQLSIAKTVTPLTNVAHHSTVTYTVVLFNDSLIDDPSVVFTDTLPAKVNFGAWVQQPAGATVTDDTVTWTGAVPAGQSVTFTFTALHVGNYADTVANSAEFSGMLQTGSDSATFNVERLLSLYVYRYDAGKVTSSPAGINCGNDCGHNYPRGTKITLTAQLAEGHYLSDWGGACNGSALTCTFTMQNDTYVGVSMPAHRYNLNVDKSGVGSGTVTGKYEHGGTEFECDEDCPFVNREFEHGTKFVLSADPAPGFVFSGWSGACTGTNRLCTLTFNAAKEVTATFSPPDHAVTATKIGDGNGAVTSNPSGIACGNDCAQTYDHGEALTLSAAADPGSVFIGWGGACTGISSTCAIFVDGERQIAAAFVVEQPGEHALTVVKTGAGNGAVKSQNEEIDCGVNCAETFTHDTVVILEATPGPNSTFAGWSGPCTGTGACNVTMDAAKSVTAAFTLNTHALHVVMVGNGAISGPPGLTCAEDCAKNFNHGALINLVATPDIGWTFTGWGGACSGMDSCAVTMDQLKSVTATFAPSTYALTVNKTGTGSGKVASDGGEIDCGDACESVREHGATLTLTATADEGSVFTGWSGACKGAGECNVTMTKARSVTAIFAQEEKENAVFLPTLQR